MLAAFESFLSRRSVFSRLPIQLSNGFPILFDGLLFQFWHLLNHFVWSHAIGWFDRDVL